jgi:DNA-binding MarR family transcriptional regulator
MEQARTEHGRAGVQGQGSRAEGGVVQPSDLDVIEVAGALRVSVGMVVRRLKQADLGSDLTLPETSALSRLDRGGPATSSDLARLEKISPQSMGVTVAALLERRLVARERDPEDGRRIMLSITEAGRDLLLARRGARTEQIARALADGFTQAELDQLKAVTALLDRLAEKL